jgi:hypothetical protein
MVHDDSEPSDTAAPDAPAAAPDPRRAPGDGDGDRRDDRPAWEGWDDVWGFGERGAFFG